jgi:ABC-type multidrug transport system fused ATPase/permease subunit
MIRSPAGLTPEEQKGGVRALGRRANMLIGDRRRHVAALAFISALNGFTEAAMLVLLAQLGVSLVKRDNTAFVHVGSFHFHAHLSTLIYVFFALTIVRLLLQFPISLLPARIAADVQASVRRRLFHTYTRASWDVQSRDREGLLQETMTSQVLQATGSAMQFTTLISALLTFVVLLASAFAVNVVAALAVLLISVTGFALLRPVRGLGVKRAALLSDAQVRFAGAVAEAVRLAEETHVFGAEAAQRRRVDAFTARSRGLFYRTQLLIKLVPNLYQSLIYLLVAGGIWGLYEFGRSHASSLGAIVLLLLRGSQSGQVVQAAYQGLNQTMPFVERLERTMGPYRDSAPVYGTLELPTIETLSFEHVDFAYRPEEPVLDDISFEIRGRESIGIVGPSGAGKSTLVQLLLRLREPGEGSFLINGVQASEFAAAHWSTQVAYVPQEPRVLHASVKENIRYFRDIDDDAIERAARLAQIHDDVVGWSAGYDTIIGPRADAVSGGHKQRICLARALAAEPQVLVLDEPTSALDPQSESLIGTSLSTLRHELTLFVVAHRMSTLDICDRVMVIVDGKLVAFDTRALLEAENPYYREASAIATGAPGGGLLA